MDLVHVDFCSVLGCPRNGCKWLGSMGYNPPINGINQGYNPLILTFDPNFLGHPSTIIEPRKKTSNFPLYWLVNRDPGL